ncbi:hypothetical protein HYT01_01190 [Candidatus Giovannonibacteria bacterium]|nr:hypothetical protein [Candidatus Giovannonibacteria bacterium]
MNNKLIQLPLFSLVFFVILFLNPQKAEADIIFKVPPSLGLISGLVGYWSFDGSDMAVNTAFDRSGQGNNGTLTGGPSRIEGKLGQALSFDGVDDYVSFGGGAGTVAYVQSKDARNAAQATTIAVTFTSATVSGNAIVGAVTWGCAFADLTSVTDNKGNSYTLKTRAEDAGNTQSIQAFYAKNITGGATHTITANINGSCSFRAIAVHEVSGVDTTAPDDGSNQQFQSAPGTGTNALTSGSFTTSANGDYIFSATQDTSANTASHTAGTTISYTRVTNGSSADVDFASEWGTQTTAGSVAGTWTSNENNGHVTAAIGLKPAAGAGPSLSTNSISFWMKAATSTTQSIIDLNGTATITESSGTLSANNFTSPTIYVDGVSGGTANDTNWHHVVVTTNSAITANAITIGKASGSVFGGRIDDIRIYNRALSSDEIKRLYRVGATLHVNTKINNDSLAKGLVGWWSFDGPDMAINTALDRSGQGNNGTLTNGPTRTIGKLGQALSFDGTSSGGGNDVVDLGATAILTGRESAWAICSWVKIDSIPPTSGSYMIYNRRTDSGGGGNFSFYVGDWTLSDRRWAVSTNNGAWTDMFASSLMPIGEWTYLCATSNGSNIFFYFNGSPDGSQTYVLPSNVANLRQTLGAFWNSGVPDDVLDGIIDDVRVYNRALSADEIKRLYNLGR